MFKIKKHTTYNANLFNIIILVPGLSTPVEMKLKLIPIFRHMHYDLQLTAKVSHSTVKGIINIYYYMASSISGH